MTCATRPVGFSEEAWAVMPAEVRSTIIEIVAALRANADKHDRLVNFLKPGTCDD